jgi:hypothetical protein
MYLKPKVNVNTTVGEINGVFSVHDILSWCLWLKIVKFHCINVLSFFGIFLGYICFTIELLLFIQHRYSYFLSVHIYRCIHVVKVLVYGGKYLLCSVHYMCYNMDRIFVCWFLKKYFPFTSILSHLVRYIIKLLRSFQYLCNKVFVF